MVWTARSKLAKRTCAYTSTRRVALWGGRGPSFAHSSDTYASPERFWHFQLRFCLFACFPFRVMKMIGLTDLALDSPAGGRCGMDTLRWLASRAAAWSSAEAATQFGTRDGRIGRNLTLVTKGSAVIRVTHAKRRFNVTLPIPAACVLLLFNRSDVHSLDCTKPAPTFA